MSRIVSRLATLAALAAGVVMLGSSAETAALATGEGLNAAADTIALTKTAQFYEGDPDWCDGPGCGFRHRGYRWRGPHGPDGPDNHFGDRRRGPHSPFGDRRMGNPRGMPPVGNINRQKNGGNKTGNLNIQKKGNTGNINIQKKSPGNINIQKKGK
jgi:hypothetical protein